MSSVRKMVQEFLDKVAVAVDAREETPDVDMRALSRGHESESLSNNELSLHSLVAKALSMAKRGGTDLLAAVSFLTTRLNCPNQGEY